MAMFKSTGVLRYFTEPRYNLRVEVDTQIAAYYCSLIPKAVRYTLNLPMYRSHISVVRNVIPSDLTKWGQYEGEIIEFEYSNTVYNSEIYYWLDVYCDRLNEIRVELGLKATNDIARPPNHKPCFHITIMNTK